MGNTGKHKTGNENDRALMEQIFSLIDESEHKALSVHKLSVATGRHPGNVRQACYDLEGEGWVVEVSRSVYGLVMQGYEPPGAA